MNNTLQQRLVKKQVIIARAGYVGDVGGFEFSAFMERGIANFEPRSKIIICSSLVNTTLVKLISTGLNLMFVSR